jgi:hypothetical protein
MNSPFNLVHIKRDVIKRTTYALDKLRIGESSKYATLAMKATILDKGDII